MTTMMRMLTQMMRLPVTVFAYSVGMFARTVQGIQEIADQGMDAISGGEQRIARSTTGEQTQPVGPPTVLIEGAMAGGAENSTIASQKEETKMSDVDLRGDDLKLVRYAIVFTKFELEWSFDATTELITYATTLDEYKGSKKSDFLLGLEGHPTPIPEKWQANNYPPPPHGNGVTFNGLPKEDRDEYVRVAVQLIDRFEREKETYKKDQTKALKTLASTVKDGKIQTQPH